MSPKAPDGRTSRSLAQRGPDFAIFSFLEDLANKTGIKDNIKSMTPASPPQVSCSASRPSKCGSRHRAATIDTLSL